MVGSPKGFDAPQTLKVGEMRLTLDPATLTKDVVVVKSVQHFRAAYGPIAREIIVVDSGGICSPDISRLNFKKLRRPIWPLDADAKPRGLIF